MQDLERKRLEERLKSDTQLRDKLGLTFKEHEDMVDSFFNYEARDDLLTKAFDEPPWSYALSGAFVFGAPIGMLIGGTVLGYGGYELGELINNTYKVTNSFMRASINTGLIGFLGISGAVTGGFGGFFSGFFVGSYFGTRKQKRKEIKQNENNR